MAWVRDGRRAAVIAVVALATALAAYAGVLVAYPVGVTVSEVAPPVHFEAGTNADAAGLGGTKVSVTLGANKTSASVSFAVTYQTTYIIDPLRIVNSDTNNAYYAKLCVETPLTSTTGVLAGATAIIEDTNGNTVTTLDLTTSGCTPEFTIAAGATYIIHFTTTLQEGFKLDDNALTAQLKLYWSPESPVPTAP